MKVLIVGVVRFLLIAGALSLLSVGVVGLLVAAFILTLLTPAP